MRFRPISRWTVLTLCLAAIATIALTPVAWAEEKTIVDQNRDLREQNRKLQAAVEARAAATQPAVSPEPVAFTEETLGNGLRVIYAPLKNAPVVHVRVLYHVGSRDERPDRQGFAHMFEHMMFRGSAHVGNQEHMSLVNGVGGISNAYTSFDQTVYHQSLPAQHLDMALYLEADRMASFKVKEDIYKTERKVVGEEWRIQQNRPYGTMYDDLVRNIFTVSSYRWTPIGNMQHLAAAGVQDLQDFFNTYYVPNNAVLVVSGDFDLESAKTMVHKYYGWIPKGPDIKRISPPEPPQTATRRATVNYRVPLPRVVLAYQTPQYASNDHYALDLLGGILGSGRSSRLDRMLVNTENPQAVAVSASDMTLQDAGVFMASAVVMQGKDADAVEKSLIDAIADVVAKGVTPEELEKAKTQSRIALIHGRQTAENIASQLGDEALLANDANRVNTALATMEAVTPADIQAVAKKYLMIDQATILRVKPDPLGTAGRMPATKPATKPAEESHEPVVREVTFPADWPAHPPLNDKVVKAKFEKGTESEIDGVKVIVMPDHRLPLVNWSVTARAGSDFDPKGKEGLASIVGDMLRRGAGGMSFGQINQDLESKGITVEVTAAGDYIRLAGASLSSDVGHAVDVSKQVLQAPAFPAEEFGKLKEQLANSLALKQAAPASVAEDEIEHAIYGDSPLGVTATPKSVASITLEDVKKWYQSFVTPKDAVLLVAGDVSLEQGQALAKELITGWKTGTMGETVDRSKLYEYPPIAEKQKILLVDHPDARGSVVRMGILGYTIHSDQKYAGTLAGQILTSGINSRLNKYVRAEKGLSYGVHGVFQPTRHGGAFMAGTDGAIETSAESISAIFEVLDKMRKEEVTPTELKEAKIRTIGLMLMGMQTIQQQATYRVDGILNGYPLDYYDVYPEKVQAVTGTDIMQLMAKYVDTGRFDIVVVAPAAAVKSQLEKLGTVEVVPMPALRDGGKAPGELLTPTKPK